MIDQYFKAIFSINYDLRTSTCILRAYNVINERIIYCYIYNTA